MGDYAVILLVAAAVAWMVTPAILWLSRRIGAVDIPDDRKVHAVPTPTLGGAAIVAGFLAALAVAWNLERFRAFMQPALSWPPTELVAVALGVAWIFLLGVVDDIRGLKAPVKLAGQIVAAGFVFLQGVRLDWFPFPPGTLVLSSDFSAIVTIAWIVIVVNAVNLIDGLDGLAAGITAIAATTFFVYTYQLGRGFADPEQSAPLISIALVGATLGFLRYNFNPAKIFMGDSGSMVLGFLLAAATVSGVGRSSSQITLSESVIFYLPIFVPLIVLAIPILDTALAVFRRTRKRRHIFNADKEHLHHRILEIGHGHRQAVLIMYAWTAVIAGAALGLALLPNPAYTLILAGPGLGIFLYTIFPRIVRLARSEARRG